jgi:hypothetical protein
MTICSLLEICRRFGRIYCLYFSLCLLLEFSLANYSTPKMDAVCSSKTSVNYYNTWRYITEDSTINSACHDNRRVKNYLPI